MVAVPPALGVVDWLELPDGPHAATNARPATPTAIRLIPQPSPADAPTASSRLAYPDINASILCVKHEIGWPAPGGCTNEFADSGAKFVQSRRPLTNSATNSWNGRGRGATPGSRGAFSSARGGGACAAPWP